ncbi:MAG TPA: citrate/2-methylcitrate synthase [Candidatus Baltobacteraceae bacterium]|nr:citrate/2-methylcitrate synthase [Candidatus Baltobacteraceae bacterium]
MPEPKTIVDRGLEGVVVGTTELSNVEGLEGRLTYRGYDIHDLAPQATFEEICYLLLFGQLPNRYQLEDLMVRLAANRMLPQPMLDSMFAFPKTAWPMDVLRTSISELALFVPHLEDGMHPSNPRAAIHLIAKTPTIVAAWDRVRRGLDPVEPLPRLSTAANFLYMRTGELPSKTAERALNTYLVLLADHSYNASTFAARVTASTRADIFAAATSAVATLEGDLHGGAPGKVMSMLIEIGKPERAETYVRDLLARGERVMGMGHREYKVRDPRAEHLEMMAKALGEASDPKWYELARALEDASNKVLREAKPDNRIYANVEFYTAPTLYSLGIPPDEFTCLFAIARMAGWTAHILEQLSNNRLIRPQARYDGPPVTPFVPLEERGRPWSENGNTGSAFTNGASNGAQV